MTILSSHSILKKEPGPILFPILAYHLISSAAAKNLLSPVTLQMHFTLSSSISQNPPSNSFTNLHTPTVKQPSIPIIQHFICEDNLPTVSLNSITSSKTVLAESGSPTIFREKHSSSSKGLAIHFRLSEYYPKQFRISAG